MRRSHPTAASDWHLLCPGCQGERTILRPQARQREALDDDAVDLYRATVLWQAELEASLPDICYVGTNFTIPSFFRPLLEQNRDLLNDLPAVGASVIRRWAESKYGAAVFLIVVPQTFGGFLNFNPHLHMLVSAGGLQESEGRWLPRLHFKERGHERDLMEMWRLALSSYLWVALQKRALVSN